MVLLALTDKVVCQVTFLVHSPLLFRDYFPSFFPEMKAFARHKSLLGTCYGKSTGLFQKCVVGTHSNSLTEFKWIPTKYIFLMKCRENYQFSLNTDWYLVPWEYCQINMQLYNNQRGTFSICRSRPLKFFVYNHQVSCVSLSVGMCDLE